MNPDQMKTDKIAILLAAYNGEKYLAQQIDSLLYQTANDWHLYIHDDGSSDSTLSIIAEYSANYPEQITVLSGAPTGGAKQNFFYLMQSVEAPYYMFCDQDDVWLPVKIEKTFSSLKSAEILDEGSLPVLAFSDLSVVDENLSIIADRMSDYQILPPERTAFNNLLIQNVITGCTVMINRKLRDLALSAANFDNIIMHDWWCALIASRFGRIAFVDEPLVLYRQHGGNSIGAQKLRSLGYLLRKVLNSDDIKQSLQRTRLQAGEFAFAFHESAMSVSRRYSSLDTIWKPGRLAFCCKNRVIMSGFSRNLGLFFFG